MASQSKPVVLLMFGRQSTALAAIGGFCHQLVCRCVFGIGICFSFGFAWAETSVQHSRELAEIQGQIKRTSADVKRLADEKASQIDALRRIEKQYGDQVNALSLVKGEIKQHKQDLQQIRRKTAETQKNLSRLNGELVGLLKSAYAMGNKRGLDILFNQHDPALSGRLLVYFDYISKARAEKLKAISADIDHLNRLEERKNAETRLLQVSLEKNQREMDALQALKAKRERLLLQLNKDFAVKQEQLASLIHDEKKLQVLVASLQKTDNDEQVPSGASGRERKAESAPASKNELSPVSRQDGLIFARLQGRLPWPVAGAIVQRFGDRRFETRWDGIVIGAREGAAIHAVAPGKVVFADWLIGYGLMIIVDHGKGYMSLYAFNQNLNKSVGDYVKTGEVLASVGRSGGRSQAALYFGIRIKGRAVDPEKWCRRLGKG